MIRTTFALLAGLALGAAALPAQAQQSYPVPKGAPFTHKHSGLKLPPTLQGMPMFAIREVAADQLDIFFNYEISGKNELISVYVYRQTAGGVPVWFDRARFAIENRPDVYGDVAATPVSVFAPPGQTNTSGLAIAYRVGKGPFRSTGLALLPMGDWLVKVRYSSASLDPDALAARLRALLGELTWPDAVPNGIAALPVQPCATPLALTGQARELKPDGAAVTADAIMSVPIIPDPKNPAATKPAPPPASWCLDSTRTRIGAVYRPGGDTASYLLTINDAGRGLFVRPALSLKDEKPAWTIQLIETARTINFLRHDRLPPPDQSISIAEAGRYGSVVSTFGDSSISINSEYLK